MTTMREIVFRAAEWVINGKKANGIAPEVASLPEIKDVIEKAIKRELQELVNQGALTQSENINKIPLYFINPQQQ